MIFFRETNSILTRWQFAGYEKYSDGDEHVCGSVVSVAVGAGSRVGLSSTQAQVVSVNLKWANQKPVSS